MSVLTEIARFSMLAFAALLFALQLGAKEVGFALGRRHAKAADPPDSVGVVVTSMLGLLAFVLGLSLAYANTRFQERRQVTLTEAQSVSTSWLRALAVEDERGLEIARMLEDYTRLRLEFIRAADAAVVDAVNRRTDELQMAIWARVRGLTRERRDPVVAALLTSLNETFDLATAQRYAFTTGPASQLLFLLLTMAMASMGGLGYQFGLRDRRLFSLTLLLLGMWTAVLVVIIDLGAPRLGRILTDPGPFLWAIESFGSPSEPSGATPAR